MITFHFNNHQPIYVQIIAQLELAIASGQLRPGEKLPSVRELAEIAKVNPNTIQRALSEFEHTGLIFTERTNGRFVTTDENFLNHYREHLARSKIQAFLQELQQFQLTNQEIINFIQQIGDHHG